MEEIKQSFFKEEVNLNQYVGVFDLKNFTFKGEEENPSLVDLEDNDPAKANLADY